MDAEYREVLKEAIERMDEWEDMGVLPNDVRLFKNKLAELYDKAHKNVVDPENFSTRVKLPEEYEDLLIDMAYAFIEHEKTGLQTYEYFLIDPMRKSLRTRFHLNTVEDVIAFTNRAEERRAARNEDRILSSDQEEELIYFGGSKGLTEDQVEEIIWLEHSGSGATYSALYNQVWKELEGYDAKSNRWTFNK
jgi:hypothetical protein